LTNISPSERGKTMPDFLMKKAFAGKLNEQGGELRAPARAPLRPDEENHAQFTRVINQPTLTGRRAATFLMGAAATA
jgi:hypothetical protein